MEAMQAMTPEQIRQVIQGGRWVSIATELRPSSNKSASGEIQPFYCSRMFTYAPGDRFACTVINYADPNGKVPLVKIEIRRVMSRFFRILTKWLASSCKLPTRSSRPDGEQHLQHRAMDGRETAFLLYLSHPWPLR